jgi:hypothetical protein
MRWSWPTCSHPSAGCPSGLKALRAAKGLSSGDAVTVGSGHTVQEVDVRGRNQWLTLPGRLVTVINVGVGTLCFSDGKGDVGHVQDLWMWRREEG